MWGPIPVSEINRKHDNKEFNTMIFELGPEKMLEMKLITDKNCKKLKKIRDCILEKRNKKENI